MMCGDGTNDVGSLKRADVGLAIVNNKDPSKEDKKKRASKMVGETKDDRRSISSAADKKDGKYSKKNKEKEREAPPVIEKENSNITPLRERTRIKSERDKLPGFSCNQCEKVFCSFF